MTDEKMKGSQRGAVFAALRSGIGHVRRNNEDAYFFNGFYASLDEMNREASIAKEFPLNQMLFAVCDGMGGLQNGEVASHAAVSNMPALVDSLPEHDFTDSLCAWVESVHHAIVECTHGGGCTMAMAYIDPDWISIAHIGDSRVYHLHDGSLQLVTKDHSKVQMMVDVGLLTAEQARSHPHRHAITRYLGMDAAKSAVCPPTIERSLPLIDGDRYLICSDGVTDMLNDAQLAALMTDSKTANACADAIYQAAMTAGGVDNATLIVLDVRMPQACA